MYFFICFFVPTIDLVHQLYPKTNSFAISNYQRDSEKIQMSQRLKMAFYPQTVNFLLLYFIITRSKHALRSFTVIRGKPEEAWDGMGTEDEVN